MVVDGYTKSFISVLLSATLIAFLILKNDFTHREKFMETIYSSKYLQRSKYPNSPVLGKRKKMGKYN